jgi:hypothetical protein
VPTAQLQVWKTIELPTFQDAQTIRQAYEQAGIKMDGTAWDAVQQDFRPVELTKVSLAKVRLSELVSQFAMSDCASFHMVRKAIGSRRFCPPELAPLLRLQYIDQPEGECVFIGMALRNVHGGCPYTYTLKNFEGQLWLETDYASPSACLGDVEFILVIPDE